MHHFPPLVGFSIEGPSEARIDCADNGDGSATVVYWPTVPGEYAVHILCNDENIPKSPYMVPISADTGKCDPNAVSSLSLSLRSPIGYTLSFQYL